jgi:hypothetical protein
MEEQNQNQGQNQAAGASKKKVWVIVAAVAALVVVIGGIFIWENYFSADAKRSRQLRENYNKAEAAMSAFEKAMREDTYGGKTPQETLDMFIDALKKGDVELASKYFMLDTNTQSPDYLTRRKWEEGLVEFKNKGELENIIKIALSTKPDLEAAISTDYFVFSARDEKGILITDIDLRLDKYSGIWKIVSM